MITITSPEKTYSYMGCTNADHSTPKGKYEDLRNVNFMTLH